MHSHLTVAEYGQFVGIRGQRLVVKDGNDYKEYPLNRIKTIQIAKSGVSFSSDVITECAVRGIKFFFLNFKGEIVSSLSGTRHHAVAKVREKQFSFLRGVKGANLASLAVHGKIRNQRSALLYFKKYHKDKQNIIDKVAGQLKHYADNVKSQDWSKNPRWREVLLGFEGQSANQYWHCLSDIHLMPEGFKSRTGRKAEDIGNKALNYGYAVLATYIWNSIINSGLEPYVGFFHVQRPGKPSLVLDLMEEYRAWVVDRVIIKHRELLCGNQLDIKMRKTIINNIHKTFNTKYHYRNRKMRLESVLQRQVYRLAGSFYGDKKYRPYYFKW